MINSLTCIRGYVKKKKGEKLIHVAFQMQREMRIKNEFAEVFMFLKQI